MLHVIKNAALAGGLAAVVAVATAAPSLAQAVVVDPYYGGSGIYSGPYGGYAYAPGYRGYRYWQPPVQYDTSGFAYSTRDLGWQGGPPTGAPANPCTSGLRAQNRC